MCYYRYVYYGACAHAEFYRSSYCDKARERQQIDDLYGRSSGTDNTPAGKPGPGPDPAAGSSSHHQQQTPSTKTTSKAPSATSHRHNSHIMSTATPSEVGTTVSWADIASEPDIDDLRQADLIPRSVQPDRDVATPYQQDSNRKHHRHHRAFQPSSAFDTAGYDNLNINIPLSPYTSDSLSMRFTNEHDDEDVHNRASSSSTPALRQSDIDTEMVRAFLSADNCFRQQSSSAFPHSISLFPPTAELPPKNSPPTTTGDNTRDAATIESKMTYETTTTDLEDHGSDQRSPRKSIPPQWMAKTKGPLLATAQRAKEREARKQKPHSESPIGSGMKTIRGARSSIDLGKLYGIEQTTFLTKNAAAAVESDITSQSATRTPKALRHTPSKGALKTPTGSPVRESPGKHSAVKTTMPSPIRSIATHEFGLDGVSQSIAITTDASPYSPSVVSSAGSTPFVSAKQSPVSPGSVPKFVTANVSHDFQILDLDLADADGIEQMTKSEHGMKSFQSTHSRGKSEPHARVAFVGCKATSSKPRVPKLSLRIPNSSSLSTDRRPPFILGSTSSSEPGTTVSPSQSSRIPRIFVPTKNEQECSITSKALQSGATLRRSTSVKTLVAEKATRPTHTIVKSSRPALRATIVNYDSTECRSSAAFVDPYDVPLPETTVVPSLRHVRTVDSVGATPILSRALAASVDEALSSISPCSSTIGEEIAVTNTTPIGDPPVQGNEDKHRRAAGATEKLDELQTATRELTAEMPKMYTSISISAATMKDTTIERDPAIIFHRKKLDASDSTISDPVLDGYASSTTSTSTGISRPSENRSDTVPIRTGGQEHSEPSQESNFASNLRATAPVFQPQQHSKPLAETQSGLPPNIIQHQQPIVLFDPFALDMNGIPWYHYMYPVPIAPYRKKGKNRKYVGPKSRGYTNNSSPTTAVQSDDTQAATRLIQATDQAKENPVSELMDIPPGKVKDITVSSPMPIPGPPIGLHSKELSANIKRSSPTTSPFAIQMDSVTRQDLICNDGGLGRTKAPIDWSSIHNVPSGFQSRSSHLPALQDSRVACLVDPQANVHPGFGRTRQSTYSQQYPGRQPYHRRPGSNGLYDNFSPAYQGRNPRAAAGVPLHATAPFPTPLPPPGPRIRVGYSTRKEYGYRAPVEKEPCGEMIIESAVEWGGGPMCNKCAESDGER